MKSGSLFALPYVGGKSGASGSGLGRWVASYLPQDVPLYVEPFAGMLGILLQRREAASEIASDLNRVVINWWRVLADPDLCRHMAALLALTPLASEQLFNDATDFLRRWEDEGQADIDAAYFWTIRACMSIYTPGIEGASTFALRLSSARNKFPTYDRLQALSNRIRRVQLVVRDALEVIRFAGREEQGLIYADPPYPSSPDFYRFGLDNEALADALKECKGLVALSGQAADPWDDLLPGFRRVSRPVTRFIGWADAQGPMMREAEEVLWMNYDPNRFTNQPSLFDA